MVFTSGRIPKDVVRGSSGRSRNPSRTITINGHFYTLTIKGLQHVSCRYVGAAKDVEIPELFGGRNARAVRQRSISDNLKARNTTNIVDCVFKISESRITINSRIYGKTPCRTGGLLLQRVSSICCSIRSRICCRRHSSMPMFLRHCCCTVMAHRLNSKRCTSTLVFHQNIGPIALETNLVVVSSGSGNARRSGYGIDFINCILNVGLTDSKVTSRFVVNQNAVSLISGILA